MGISEHEVRIVNMTRHDSHLHLADTFSNLLTFYHFSLPSRGRVNRFDFFSQSQWVIILA